METERLILDALRETDKEDYFTNISHDKKVLETFVCRYAETLEDFDFSGYPGRRDLFAIRQKETGRLIGIILRFDGADGSSEIGYGIGSAHWGKGYATEAARRFLDYCFDEAGDRCVCASYFPGNDASRRVMEKCGMAYSRVSEKELSYLGVERDLIYYEIRREPCVLLLNGPSSAGKSSVAAAMLEGLRREGTEAVVVSLDDYLPMSPDAQIWEDDVFAVMPALCRDVRQALETGKTVLVDHVITSERIKAALDNAAAGWRLLQFLVSCDAETLRRREAARGDRCAGSAEASLRYLYPKTGYALRLDSGAARPEALAEQILRFLGRPLPAGCAGQNGERGN